MTACSAAHQSFQLLLTAMMSFSHRLNRELSRAERHDPSIQFELQVFTAVSIWCTKKAALNGAESLFSMLADRYRKHVDLHPSREGTYIRYP